MTTQQETQTLNGWDMQKFQQMVDQVKQQPDAGKLTFRTRTTWDSGFATESRTVEAEQLGQKMPRRFVIRSDHPPELLGENTGQSAAELLLNALGTCVTGTYAAHATARGVKIDELEFEVEGEIDLNGFLGLKEDVRSGFQQITLRTLVKSDADDETLTELCDIAAKMSPVYDSVANGVGIRRIVERIR